MTEDKNKKFHGRPFTSFIIVFSFLIMSISGIFLLFFFASTVWSQTQDSTKKKSDIVIGKSDSTAEKRLIDSTNISSKRKMLKGFIDKNANGIDDRLENKMGKGKQKGKKDKFIDRNGDGICDGRESAFGIKKAFRKRKGSRKY